MVAKQHSEDMDHFWWNLYWEMSDINYPIPNSSSYSNCGEFLSQYVWISKGHDVTACLRATTQNNLKAGHAHPATAACQNRN